MILSRIANYFHTAGFSKGDSVALFMSNRPEFVCIWLGLSKIGKFSDCLKGQLQGHTAMLAARQERGKLTLPAFATLSRHGEHHS